MSNQLSDMTVPNHPSTKFQLIVLTTSLWPLLNLLNIFELIQYLFQHANVKGTQATHPIVVIKLVVKEPSEKRRSRQLFPTPAKQTKRKKLRWKLLLCNKDRHTNLSQNLHEISIIKLTILSWRNLMPEAERSNVTPTTLSYQAFWEPQHQSIKHKTQH